MRSFSTTTLIPCLVSFLKRCVATGSCLALLAVLSATTASGQVNTLIWDLFEGDQLNLKIEQEISQENRLAANDFQSQVNSRFNVTWTIVGTKALDYLVEQNVVSTEFEVINGTVLVKAHSDSGRNTENVPDSLVKAIEALGNSTALIRLDRYGKMTFDKLKEGNDPVASSRHQDILKIMTQVVVRYPGEEIQIGQDWKQSAVEDESVDSVYYQCRFAEQNENVAIVKTEARFDDEFVKQSYLDQAEKDNQPTPSVTIQKNEGGGEFRFDIEKKVPLQAEQSYVLESRIEGQQLVLQKIQAVNRCEIELQRDLQRE